MTVRSLSVPRKTRVCGGRPCRSRVKVSFSMKFLPNPNVFADQQQRGALTQISVGIPRIAGNDYFAGLPQGALEQVPAILQGERSGLVLSDRADADVDQAGQ